MEREFEYNNHKYWVKVSPVFNQITNSQGGYMAWLNNEQPGSLLYGQVVSDDLGRPILFGDESTALALACNGSVL